MKYILFFIPLVFLSACQTVPSRMPSDITYQEIAETNTCAEISQSLYDIDEILESQTPSETQRLFEQTAVSAAKTGVYASGALGSAGSYAGIGINFVQGLLALMPSSARKLSKMLCKLRKYCCSMHMIIKAVSPDFY